MREEARRSRRGISRADYCLLEGSIRLEVFGLSQFSDCIIYIISDQAIGLSNDGVSYCKTNNDLMVDVRQCDYQLLLINRTLGKKITVLSRTVFMICLSLFHIHYMSKQIAQKPKIIRTQDPSQSDSSKYHLSQDIVTFFTQLIRDDISTAAELPSQTIHQLCQQELKRLLKIKAADKKMKEGYVDNELTVSVLDLQSKILLNQGEGDQQHPHPVTERNQHEWEEVKENLIVKRNENLMRQVQRNEEEIRTFMGKVLKGSEIDFASCLAFFAEKSLKLKGLGKQKLVSSRMKLLQILNFFLRQAAKKLQPERFEQGKEDELLVDGSFMDEVSFLSQGCQKELPHETLTYDEVNTWSRYSSKFIEDKIIELSGICEQITQLEVFSRTLQFSQLESSQKISFFRVVEVLISLHHRISYLSRKKPTLMKQLEHACSQISFINGRIEEFLGQMNQQSESIIPINFGGLDERWKSQLSEHFTELQVHLNRLSEIIISQDNFHTDNYRNIERFVKIVEMFSKVMAGDQEVTDEWIELINSLQHEKDSPAFSPDEYRLLMLLDDCLSLDKSKIRTLRSNPGQQSNRTSEQLEVEVTKLIEDYQRVKRDNLQLASDLQLEQRLKEELLVEVDERDKIIKNLTAKKFALQKKLNKQEENSGASSRVKEDELKRIEHETQKYRQGNLLLKEQLRISESQREKLLEMAETEKGQYLKTVESANRLKAEKQRLEIECEQLKNRIQVLKNENLRHTSRLNKIITDLTNDKSLLEMQIDTAEKNNMRLMERLDLNEKKLGEYSKLIMARLDEKDENALPKYEKEAERLRKELELSQTEIKDLEQQNKSLKDEVLSIKIKLKESQQKREEEIEASQLLAQIRSKFDKAQAKNQSLSRMLEESKAHEEELEEAQRQSGRRIKELEAKNKGLEMEMNRVSASDEQSKRKCHDLQNQLEELRRWVQKELRNYRESASKKELELIEKSSSLKDQELKIRLLEEQLAQKTKQSEKTSQELIETRIKQYESTIETHKLISLKLEEQNKSLKKDLDEKVENEFRLTSEIDRLSKEIDRMKAQLDKYLRELTEKELVIKLEREKNDEQIKRLREYEVRQKLKKQQSNTPKGKGQNELDTPSQFEDRQSTLDPLSRSNMRYDNYFNARQYDRLSKEYNDFRRQASLRIENLQNSLEEALKNNELLKIRALQSETGQRNEEADKLRSEIFAQKSEMQRQKRERDEKQRELLGQINFSQQELKKMEERMREQSSNITIIQRERNSLESKLITVTREKEEVIKSSKEDDSRQIIKRMEEKNRQLEQQLRKLKEDHLRLKQEMDRQTKNMFNHYQAEMKRVISETDSVNSRLVAEVNSLRKQVFAQTSSSTDKDRESVINELKRTVELLLGQKNKFLQDNSKILAEKSSLQRQKAELMMQIRRWIEKGESQSAVIFALESRIKTATNEDLSAQLSATIRQRDLIRSQHDSLRFHLEEETKRAICLESQLIKSQEELQRMKIAKGKQNAENVDYLKAQIKALEAALKAVSDELSESKALLGGSREATRSTHLDNELTRQQSEWNRKEKVYLQKLQSMSRQIVSLNNFISGGRRNQRLIVTSLPAQSKPSKSTYKQGGLSSNRSLGLIKVERFLDAKRRWENVRFSQSLSRWGVPQNVSQQIQEMRSLFVTMSEMILSINQEQIEVQMKLKAAPSLDNIVQYAYRILTFFSDINPNSQEAIRIRGELESIAREYGGGLFFTMLETYTIHVLQNNTVEEYKSELRLKANELLEIKQKLEDVINRQIQQAELQNRSHIVDHLQVRNYVQGLAASPSQR